MSSEEQPPQHSERSASRAAYERRRARALLLLAASMASALTLWELQKRSAPTEMPAIPGPKQPEKLPEQMPLIDPLRLKEEGALLVSHISALATPEGRQNYAMLHEKAGIIDVCLLYREWLEREAAHLQIAWDYVVRRKPEWPESLQKKITSVVETGKSWSQKAPQTVLELETRVAATLHNKQLPSCPKKLWLAGFMLPSIQLAVVEIVSEVAVFFQGDLKSADPQRVSEAFAAVEALNKALGAAKRK